MEKPENAKKLARLIVKRSTGRELDTFLLHSGDEFGSFPELITIWILEYDPFGEGRVIYTIKNIVAENPDIVYNDGITTLILNAKGSGSGNEELEKLLEFFIDTDKEVKDTELLDIQNIVKSIKGGCESR